MLRQWRIVHSDARAAPHCCRDRVLSLEGHENHDGRRAHGDRQVVAADPTVGDLIKATGGLRKLRIPLEGRGKRGGARVIYWFHSERYPAVLLWVFAKNERPDLTDKQRKALAAATAAFLDGAGD